MLLAGGLFANTELFHAANKAYQAENYEEAVQLYEKALASGEPSLALYYNMGNAYFKTQELGKCILYYEKALRIAPNDADTQENLATARQLLKDNIPAIQPFFLTKWWNGLRDTASSTTWAILAILMMVIGIGGLGVWQLAQTRKFKKIGFAGGLSAIGLALLMFALSHTKYQIEQHSGMAIVLTKEVPLRKGADDISEEVLPLHEGTKVELLDKIGTWYKVRLANGELGWLPFEAVGVI